jgi:hypothetical protein
MSAHISRATVVGGHDGRAEIEVELTYPNDLAGVGSLDELVGQPWSIVLPALDRSQPSSASQPAPSPRQEHAHARSGHP